MSWQWAWYILFIWFKSDRSLRTWKPRCSSSACREDSDECETWDELCASSLACTGICSTAGKRLRLQYSEFHHRRLNLIVSFQCSSIISLLSRFPFILFLTPLSTLYPNDSQAEQSLLIFTEYFTWNAGRCRNHSKNHQTGPVWSTAATDRHFRHFWAEHFLCRGLGMSVGKSSAHSTENTSIYHMDVSSPFAVSTPKPNQSLLFKTGKLSHYSRDYEYEVKDTGAFVSSADIVLLKYLHRCSSKENEISVPFRQKPSALRRTSTWDLFSFQF